MLHLEFLARSDDDFLSGNALYLLAKILIADKRFNEAHSALENAVDN